MTCEPIALQSPEGLNIEIERQQPLAHFDEPDVQITGVPNPPLDEPFVPVDHPRVQLCCAYWNAGYKDAYPGAHLRKSVARRLYSAAESLPLGFSIAVLDAWRSNKLQGRLYEESLDLEIDQGFVLPPLDDYEQSTSHPAGTTIDLTLAYRDKPLALGTDFDEMTNDAFADAFESKPGLTRELRRLLYWTLSAQGFVGYHQEWWEYHYGSRYWAAITGKSPMYVGAQFDVSTLQQNPTLTWRCSPRR